MTIIEEVASLIRSNGKRDRKVLCRCECGKLKVTMLHRVLSSGTKSCGCLAVEKIKAWSKTGIARRTHGMTGTRFYKIYKGIKNRCINTHNQAYMYYGGRGIKCEWNSFEEFKQDMYSLYLAHFAIYGETNTSIERVDMNGNYSKNNCIWANNIQQGNNTRHNRLIEFKGKINTMAEWARLYNLKYQTLAHRLYKGIDIAKALTLKWHY